MERRARGDGRLRTFATIQPRAVSLADEDRLVRSEVLDVEAGFPLLIQPEVSHLDLAEWGENNLRFIESELHTYGALLFRGFAMPSVAAFEQFALGIAPDLFNENGEHPRESISGKVYTPVFYAPEKKLLWHNENSFNYRWPGKIWFCCAQPAQQGGETPLVDSRKVFQRLDPRIRDRFVDKEVMYVRNYGGGLGLDWQTVFATADRARVEEICREDRIEPEWKESGHLRTRCIRPAVARHPKTRQVSWFNQAQHWHVSCLDDATRRAVESLFCEDDLPRNCYYGDGSPIEDSVMAEVLGIYQSLEVTFPWQKGDILMVDNVLTAHGRNPFLGERKLLVALGDMRSYAECGLQIADCGL